jgi:hypothetical protein
MVKKIPVPPDRQAELAADLRRKNTRDIRLGLRQYLKWLKSGEDHAAMLCRSGVPAWVAHAEKGGDGGFTNAERRTLEKCSTVKIVTIPGSVSSCRTRRPTRSRPSSARRPARSTRDCALRPPYMVSRRAGPWLSSWSGVRFTPSVPYLAVFFLASPLT